MINMCSFCSRSSQKGFRGDEPALHMLSPAVLYGNVLTHNISSQIRQYDCLGFSTFAINYIKTRTNNNQKYTKTAIYKIRTKKKKKKEK